MIPNYVWIWMVGWNMDMDHGWEWDSGPGSDGVQVSIDLVHDEDWES